MLPLGSIVCMREGPYFLAEGIIINEAQGRYRLWLVQRGIFYWARTTEFDLVATRYVDDYRLVMGVEYEE